jgi:hypothetical protein
LNPTISFSNFYECPVTDYWVVTGYQASGNDDGNGMTVRNCIFNGNAGNRDVGIQGTTRKITIEGCFFSGSFPSDSFVTRTGDNYENLETNSYKLFAINTEYCPAVHLATLSNSPAASTRPFMLTSPLLPSPVPPSSRFFEETWLPVSSSVHAGTGRFDRSNGFPATLSLSVSPAFDSSLHFPMTSDFEISSVFERISRTVRPPSGTLSFTKSLNRRRAGRFVLRTSFFLWFGYFSNS